MKCFDTPSCTSLNMASAEDEDGTFWCELLFDNIFNKSQNFKQNSTSRHVKKWTPCINAPCQNGGSCMPNYNDESYTCFCRAGFGGDDCQIGCHANWTLFNNHCYKYFQDHLRGYSEAKAQCKTFGAFLVTVHSKEENDYLWSLFSPSGHAVWAGGNDEQVEGSWVWEDGVAWGSFVFWNRGEPNGGSRENCISMRHQDGKWNDLHCTTLSYYICKN
ncbi:brevican core protein-like isoform X2 [Stylophora pistillata]|nr:brevican core protein-like isoform X2 [Stylophora pistillata]